jgi:oxalate decarboxylase/phosphoglucose isomerase-like protein (cupin superfamily)
MTVGYLGPCGINLPHTHPRATEINFSVDGDFQVGFYQENGAVFIMNDVYANQAAVFPQGSIHFEQNMNCNPVTFVAAFNSEDPGVLTISTAFFGAIPATVVGASLGGLNITTVEDIRLQLVKNPAIGIAECRQKCGL